MQWKKTLFSLTLLLLILFFNSSLAFSEEFSDVSKDYWAYTEIQSLSDLGIISGYPDQTFKPENTVKRAEFTSMVIKTLNKENISVNVANIFTDINKDFWGYETLLRSLELELIVGYPDCTFRPCNQITKSEATSIISKTVKNCEMPCNDKDSCSFTEIKYSELKQFADNEQVANWARPSFTKAVKNDLYVNHPDKNYLTPNNDLTRAEAAVLLYKIRQNPSVVVDKYKGPKLYAEKNRMVVEHLAATPYTASVNEVHITGLQATILAENIFPVRFVEKFTSKGSNKGDTVYLVFNKDLVTQEGTTLVPAGSKISAEIVDIKRGKPFHINGEVELNLLNLVTKSGAKYPLTATIVNNELFDPGFGACNLKRMGTIALTTTAAGTLMGLTVSADGDIGEGTVAGVAIGGGLGALFGLAAPGCGVNIPADKDIYIKLGSDLDVNLD